MVVQSIQRSAYHALEEPDLERRSHRLLFFGLLSLIVLNVALGILGTVDSFEASFPTLLSMIEKTSIFVFSLEYVVRIWSAGSDPRFTGLMGRVRFALQPFILIDAIATFPALLAPTLDLRSLRVVRVLRLLRGIKVARYSKGLQIVINVVRQQKEQLMLCLSLALTLLVFSASLVYFAENPAQPTVFTSIPATMWWAVCTLTTVGYGDVYPVTPFGKTLASMLALFGVGLFALPAGILAAGFARHAEEAKRCPDCGRIQDQLR